MGLVAEATARKSTRIHGRPHREKRGNGADMTREKVNHFSDADMCVSDGGVVRSAVLVVNNAYHAYPKSSLQSF